ncbi:MAG: tripartite tricarboxylate transporter substrate binding protein [Betaproteobacteria bacterium]
MHATTTWAAAALLAVIAGSAAAQYPNKPIHIVVPSAPGDGSDLTARLISDKLAAALGQPVIVENKLGAGGVVGTEYAARQPADGYTLIMANAGSHAINAALYSKLSYDPARDFVAVALVSVSPNMMSVNPSLPVRTVGEFIAYAKANPGKINYASGGNGSSAHLSAELFKSMTGVQMNHVPYKGSTPALTDLIGGQVQVMIGNLPPMLPQVKAGKLRALAVTTAKRYPGLPDVPTVAESGLTGFETVAWFGLFAPAGTPRDIVLRLNREVNAIAGQPDMRERLLALGMEPALGTPEDYTARQTADIAKWKKVVAESGARID